MVATISTPMSTLTSTPIFAGAISVILPAKRFLLLLASRTLAIVISSGRMTRCASPSATSVRQNTLMPPETNSFKSLPANGLHRSLQVVLDTDQVRHELRFGMPEYLLRWGDVNQFPVLHHADSVCQRDGLLIVVGHMDDRSVRSRLSFLSRERSSCLDLASSDASGSSSSSRSAPAARLRARATRWYSPPDRLSGFRSSLSAMPVCCGCFRDLFGNRPLSSAPQRVGDVLVHGQVRKQAGVLVYDADIPFLNAADSDILPSQADAAGFGFQSPAMVSSRRLLPTPDDPRMTK